MVGAALFCAPKAKEELEELLLSPKVKELLGCSVCCAPNPEPKPKPELAGLFSLVCASGCLLFPKLNAGVVVAAGFVENEGALELAEDF